MSPLKREIIFALSLKLILLGVLWGVCFKDHMYQKRDIKQLWFCTEK